MKTCKSCQLELEDREFHKGSKTLASGEKRYYYDNKCMSCQYIAAKAHKQQYYQATKYLKRGSYHSNKWRAKNKRQGRCQGCSLKLTHQARLCLTCYIGHWIRTTASRIRQNTVMTLPRPVLEHRAKILSNNKLVLAALPGSQGYPINRLGHICPVRMDANQALLATNIQWVKHKPRGGFKNKCLELQ